MEITGGAFVANRHRLFAGITILNVICWSSSNGDPLEILKAMPGKTVLTPDNPSEFSQTSTLLAALKLGALFTLLTTIVNSTLVEVSLPPFAVPPESRRDTLNVAVPRISGTSSNSSRPSAHIRSGEPPMLDTSASLALQEGGLRNIPASPCTSCTEKVTVWLSSLPVGEPREMPPAHCFLCCPELSVKVMRVEDTLNAGRMFTGSTVIVKPALDDVSTPPRSRPPLSRRMTVKVLLPNRYARA